MATLAAMREELEAKRKALKDIFDQYPELDMDETIVSDIQTRNKEINDLSAKYEKARELHLIAEDTRTAVAKASEDQAQKGLPLPMPRTDVREGPTAKGLGTSFVEAEAYKSAKGHANPKFTVEAKGLTLKTLMTTTAGFPPENVRGPRVELMAMRRPVVASLIPQDDIDQTAVIYMEETTFTNNAAPVSEGGQKAESALAYTQRTIPLEVIATWLPVTRQQLDDVNQIRPLIDNRLTMMLLLAEEVQLLTGDGVSPNLQGFLTKTGVQTQARGADPSADAFYKAMTLVRWTGFAEPSGHIIHPNDWQVIRLMRTADGIYIWGHPSEVGPERLWGLPVVPTPAITENTGLTGDFQLYSHISRKWDIEIAVSDSHSDFFIKNQLAIRAEERLSLEIYRAAAFAKVTGLEG